MQKEMEEKESGIREEGEARKDELKEELEKEFEERMEE